MRYLYSILLLIMQTLSCVSVNHVQNKANPSQSLAYLTNNSIKFWETYPNFTGESIGLYFCSNGICDEYNIDDNHKRIFRFYGDCIMEKPFHFKLRYDSLYMYVNGCYLPHCVIHGYKIIKITQDSLILQETFTKNDLGLLVGDSIYVNNYFYFPAKNQHTKPKFWYQLYPHDKSRWPYGSY
jgi:hypothetical protein